jgi:uncharacterized protein
MNFLITGGTGCIGRHVTGVLSNNNNSVIVLSRKNRQDVSSIKYITSLEMIESSQVIDCIINLAGMPIDWLWTKKYRKELLDSRVGVTHQLIQLISRLTSKPKVMISASAIGYYGSGIRRGLTEGSSVNSSFTHDLCHQWEKEALRAEDMGVRVVISRLGVLLAKDSGFIKRTWPVFVSGLGGKIGHGKQYFSWVHVHDVISAFQYFIHQNSCQGIYNLTSPGVVTNGSFTRTYGQVLNRATWFSVPKFLIKNFLGQMGEELLLNGNEVLPGKLLSEGFNFKYLGVDEALKEVCK